MDSVNPFKQCSLSSPEFVYKMDHSKQGRFIIINNKSFSPDTRTNEHLGIDKDAASLCEIFENFGFTVTLINNMKRDDMLKLMTDAGQEDHSNCDWFGVAILSHRDDDGLYGTDSDIPIAIEDFVKPIKNCQSLIGKPKIFFFPVACRASDKEQADAIGKTGNPGLGFKPLPAEADLLYVYSTVPGNASQQNSSFVRALIRVFSQAESRAMDFVHALTRVISAVASRPEMRNNRQVPSVMSSLTRDISLA